MVFKKMLNHFANILGWPIGDTQSREKQKGTFS